MKHREGKKDFLKKHIHSILWENMKHSNLNVIKEVPARSRGRKYI